MSRRPIFVLACYRSGTTLLRYLLDAHPRIFCPPESKFISGLRAFYEYPQAVHGLGTLGVSEEQVLRRLRGLTESFLEGCTRRAGKKVWVDKTPSYHRDVAFLEKMFEREARYIVMVRHPLDCIDSLGRFFPHESESHFNADIVQKVRAHGTGREAWARFWVEVYENLHPLLLEAPKRTRLLRYEALVDDPAGTLRPLCRFIGEKYSPRMLDQAFTMEHRKGFQDSSIRRTTKVHSDSIGRWKSWPAREARAVWKIVAPTAAKYGYRKP
jgi:hypothetical protein